MSQLIAIARIDTAAIARKRGVAHNADNILGSLFIGKEVELLVDKFFCTMDLTTWERTAEETLPKGTKVKVLASSNAGFRGIEFFCEAPSGMTQQVSIEDLGFQHG